MPLVVLGSRIWGEAETRNISVCPTFLLCREQEVFAYNNVLNQMALGWADIGATAAFNATEGVIAIQGGKIQSAGSTVKLMRQ